MRGGEFHLTHGWWPWEKPYIYQAGKGGAEPLRYVPRLLHGPEFLVPEIV